MKIKFYFFITIIFCFFINFAIANNLPKEYSESNFYILMDGDTKEVLLSQNSNVKIAPSSMTKLMTAYVIFDQIKNKKISLDNQCLIGKNAWNKSGSSMFLKYGDMVSIEQLLSGLLAVSGNDAAVALAESIAGSIENFVSLMNLKAKEIGLKNSNFKNPHGLNEDNHYMTIEDLANLTFHIYHDFPEYLHYLSIPKFSYRNITQQNRNPLIQKNYDGIIGGKTGHTNQGGYGVAAIVKRNHRSLIAVVNMAKTPKQRANAITGLFDYGFNAYKKIILFENLNISKIPIWLGNKKNVDVELKEKISLNLPYNKNLDDIKVWIKYKSPLHAPIKKELEVGKLFIEIKDYKKFEYPLFTKNDIPKLDYVSRIKEILLYKIKNLKTKIKN